MKEKSIKVLGQGSYGYVALVKITTAPSIQRYYAKKISFLKGAPNLEKELRILAHFRDNPNIVQCESRSLTFGRLRTGVRVCGIYLEYASGGTLSDLIAENDGGRLPESDVRRYTRMILAGLAALHKEDYVHCDLKPSNILVLPSASKSMKTNNENNEWVLKISDFGQAKEPHEGCLVATTKRPGTPQYMSPEAVGPCGLVGTALDIWSLGCVVVEMFGGSPTTKEEPVVWWNIPENMPATAKDFMNKCMAIDPSDRWSADELMNHPFVAETEVPLENRSPVCHDEWTDESDDESQHRMCGGWIAKLLIR